MAIMRLSAASFASKSTPFDSLQAAKLDIRYTFECSVSKKYKFERKGKEGVGGVEGEKSEKE